MDGRILLIFSCTMMAVSAWSIPYYPDPRPPLRVTRYAPPPPAHFFRQPIRVLQPEPEELKLDRPKRNHHDYDDHDHDHHDHEPKNTHGITGPVHTFVKTDKHANYKWGVRHHVGNKYAP